MQSLSDSKDIDLIDFSEPGVIFRSNCISIYVEPVLTIGRPSYEDSQVYLKGT